MTLRVGVNARTFVESEPGGAIQAAKKTTRALVESTDTEVILFGHGSIRRDFSEVDVHSEFCWHDSQGYGVIWERTVLPRLARRADVDVLYCPNGNGPLTEQPFDVVTCIHDVNSLKGFSGGIHTFYRKTTIPRVVTVSDRLVTVSEFSKREIVDAIAVPPEKISVVYNGIDAIYHRDGDGERLDLPDKYVLFVGSLNPRKNISGLIEAFHRFREETDTDHKLVIVGPGNKSIFEDFDIEESRGIVRPGFLSQAELKYAYTHADLFAYPSFYEGFGLPPLEAAACGTPVLVSDRPPFTETFEEGSAEFVDPCSVQSICDGIKNVTRDPSYWHKLAQRGKEQSRQFTWAQTISQLSNTMS